jgi:hypothetical protein
MHTFLTLNRDNIIAGIISSVIVSAAALAISALSKLPPVPVPAWLVLAFVVFPIGWWVVNQRRRTFTPIVGVTFGVEKVVCDGRHFIDCKFDGTELVFHGTRNFSMQNCKGHVARISFGGSAGLVLGQLAALNQDPFFKKHLEATLQGMTNSSS